MGAGPLSVTVLLVLIAALTWAATVFCWRESRTPVPPYDPTTRLRDVLGRSPADFARSYEDDGPIHIAEVSSRVGSGPDDDNAVGLSLRVRSRDGVMDVGERTNAVEHFAPGRLLPIRVVESADGERRASVAAVSEGKARRLLLRHGRDTGLFDADTHAILSHGRTSTVPVRRVRPTGRLHAGRVQVVVAFDAPDGTRREVTGFLRPPELAAVRLLGVASASRDDEGRWALGPTWY